MNSSQFNKILVVKHGSLGDIAFSLLAMASIKQFFNNATIDLLTEEKYINFLSNSNYFSSIFKDNRKGIIESLKVIIKINQNKYDILFFLENLQVLQIYQVTIAYLYLIEKHQVSLRLFCLD